MGNYSGINGQQFHVGHDWSTHIHIHCMIRLYRVWSAPGTYHAIHIHQTPGTHARGQHHLVPNDPSAARYENDDGAFWSLSFLLFVRRTATAPTTIAAVPIASMNFCRAFINLFVRAGWRAFYGAATAVFRHLSRARCSDVVRPPSRQFFLYRRTYSYVCMC